MTAARSLFGRTTRPATRSAPLSLVDAEHASDSRTVPDSDVGARAARRALRLRQADRPAIPLPPVIANYRLGRALGFGGMSEVVEAFDTDRRRSVALKVMRPTDPGRRSEREAWDREVSILRAIDHPGVVPLLDAGIGEGGELYIAMPLLEGRSARGELASLRRCGLEARAAASYDILLPALLNLCDTLQHVHQQGVLHCDLKPSNVFLPRPGSARCGRGLLLDWGVSVMRERGRVVSQGEGGRPGGTPGYMSPEQIVRRVADLDPRSDVYGLGALLYEFLTWRPAIRRGSPERMFHETLLGALLPPEHWRGPVLVPPLLSSLCMRALALRPDDRPADPAEFARQLRAALRS